jgi:hypothetical protein
MKLADAQQWFASRGLTLRWRDDVGPNGKAPAILRPPAGTDLPVGPLGLAVVLPDMHLGIGNDVFRFNDSTREHRFERLLRALVALRDELANEFRGFSAVQLGDFYDLMRVPGTSARMKRELIDDSYPEVIRLTRSLPVLHCIGNHDKDFWEDPPADHEAKYAIARTLGGPELLCFHGHDKVTLFNIVEHNLAETFALTALNAINSLPLLGKLTSWIQSRVDGSLADDAILTTTSEPWPAGVAGPAGWSAPWVAHGGAVDLATVIRGFEKGLGTQIKVAFFGHTHRPGISWAPVTQQRSVPIVDVGSWTYGRAELALVASDGVGLCYLT